MPTATQLRQYAEIIGGLLNRRGANLQNLDINDARMQGAIAQFQKANGLRPTGIADAQTFALLQKPPMPITGAMTAGGGASGANMSGAAPMTPAAPQVPPPGATPPPQAPMDPNSPAATQQYGNAFNQYMKSGAFMDGGEMAYGNVPGGGQMVTSQGMWDKPPAPVSPALAAAAQRMAGNGPAPDMSRGDPWSPPGAGAARPLVAPWNDAQAADHNKAIALERAAQSVARQGDGSMQAGMPPRQNTSPIDGGWSDRADATGAPPDQTALSQALASRGQPTPAGLSPGLLSAIIQALQMRSP